MDLKLDWRNVTSERGEDGLHETWRTCAGLVVMIITRPLVFETWGVMCDLPKIDIMLKVKDRTEAMRRAEDILRNRCSQLQELTESALAAL